MNTGRESASRNESGFTFHLLQMIRCSGCASPMSLQTDLQCKMNFVTVTLDLYGSDNSNMNSEKKGACVLNELSSVWIWVIKLAARFIRQCQPEWNCWYVVLLFLLWVVRPHWELILDTVVMWQLVGLTNSWRLMIFFFGFMLWLTLL